MTRKSKIKRGGKGMRFEDRNRLLVEARLSNPKHYSWGRLGRIFGIGKMTAKEIFERDEGRYRASVKGRKA